MSNVQVDLRAINGTDGSDAGVEHGAALVAFVEAAMRKDTAGVERERRRLAALLAPGQFVETAAIIATFEISDRVANATGIPIDEMVDAMSRDFREELKLDEFASAANSATHG